MKLVKAIEWEIPIITTVAGSRGYVINKGNFIQTGNTPHSMAIAILKLSNGRENEYNNYMHDIKVVKQSSSKVNDVKENLKYVLRGL